ncbi:uncharacterized protein LOC135384488 [Ornithodoros turicata]|uniref:uncharacterized protein LOC135384488 n=1 Tax=Ornithodoros turicata TaxID=34597 RepID=UPI003139CDC7
MSPALEYKTSWNISVSSTVSSLSCQTLKIMNGLLRRILILTAPKVVPLQQEVVAAQPDEFGEPCTNGPSISLSQTAENNTSRLNGVLWPDKAVRFLLSICQEEEERSGTMKFTKAFWSKASGLLAEKGYTLTSTQCSDKWKNLKKTYKTVADSKNKSVNGSQKWEYWSIMHDILGKKPEIQPPALASTSSGLHLLEDQEQTSETPHNEVSPPRKKSRTSKNNVRNAGERLRLENERVEQLRTFNQLFREYLEMKKVQMNMPKS